MHSRGDAGAVLVVDGKPILFELGETLAAVLIRAGMWRFRTNLASGEARGAYCGMGMCFECELDVVGSGRLRACMTRARDQMVVTTGGGLDPAPNLDASVGRRGD